jgi:hypothetical protein
MIASPLLLSTRVGRGDVLSTEISGRLVLMNAAKGNAVNVDDIGREIWQRLEQSKTVVQLCEELQGLYDVDGPALESDVIAFLETLRLQGLVQVLPSE